MNIKVMYLKKFVTYIIYPHSSGLEKLDGIQFEPLLKKKKKRDLWMYMDQN
jgi:hypothetical protein